MGPSAGSRHLHGLDRCARCALITFMSTRCRWGRSSTRSGYHLQATSNSVQAALDGAFTDAESLRGLGSGQALEQTQFGHLTLGAG